MINFAEAGICNFIFHRISNDADLCFVSDAEHILNSSLDTETIKKIFLKPFVTNATTYEFTHNISLPLNPLYNFCTAIFNKKDFVAASKDIFQHLQNVSKHPNIKDGDVFIVHYDGVAFNDALYHAIGIYKVENKESFIETASFGKAANMLQFKEGIGARKLDKACLILCTEEPYTIFTIDTGSSEADYWQNEFIKTKLKNDGINSTSQFLQLTKTFLTDQLPQDFNISKADQIDLLNRSVDYFKSNESFDKQTFEQTVFHHENIITSFRNFDEKYRGDHEVAFTDNFDISAQAVKKQARIFKSVLKLDKNFHIYIHGNRDLIEQGTDEKGRKFYKLYFEEEN